VDAVDIVTRNESQIRRMAVENIQGALRAPRPSAFFCSSCEEVIPDSRRLAVPGCNMCIDCQKNSERRGV